MMPKNVKDIYKDYQVALQQLENALKEDIVANPIALDGTIQRFEFTFELAWKLMKKILEFNGTRVDSPRPVIKEAFQKKYIEDGDGWIVMLEDRNQTVYTYDKKKAQNIYNNIRDLHIQLLQNLSQSIVSFLPV